MPRGSHRPRISYPPVRVHVFAAYTFDLGRERLRLDSGEEINIYSQERSVVDAVRLRGRVGTGVATRPSDAICDARRSTGELLRLARRLRTGGPMADALEVLTDEPSSDAAGGLPSTSAAGQERGARDPGALRVLPVERFLYRLSASPYRDRFVLKGGLLLTVLGVCRPTRDADVLAWGIAGDEETLLAVIREVASIPVDDGMTFDVSQARATTIRSTPSTLAPGS